MQRLGVVSVVLLAQQLAMRLAAAMALFSEGR